MGFIRVKKISGNEYAYLVENKWYKRSFKKRGKGSRQRVSKYLGRVFSFEKVHDVDFLSFKNRADVWQYLVDTSQEAVIKDLVLWEFHRHAIDINRFSLDFRGKKVRKGNKEVVLKMNEGFLCSYTLRRLFNLTSSGSYYLAKCFIEAGVEIPQDVFVGLFVE